MDEKTTEYNEEGGDNIYDPGLAFRALEESFQTVMEDLDRNDRLGHFSGEFQRLMDAIRESHGKEREQVEKNRSLLAQIAANGAKVEAALQLSQSDQETIDKLKQEIESAWKMVDAAHTREQNAQETIENMRLQIMRLSQEIEQSKKQGLDDELELGAISKNKEAMLKERERMQNEIVLLKERIKSSAAYLENIEKKNEENENKISDLSQELEKQTTELQKSQRLKERLEQDVKDLRDEFRGKENDIKALNVQISQNTKLIIKMESTIRELKLGNERLNHELNEANMNTKTLRIEFEHQTATCDKLQHEINEKNKDLKLKDEEVNKTKLEVSKAFKEREVLLNKIANVQNQKSLLEGEKHALISEMNVLEKEMNGIKKQITDDKKKMDIMTREKEMISKAAQKAAAFTQEQQKLIALQELHKKKLEDELGEQTETLTKQTQELNMLKNEKDKLNTETVQLNSKIEDYVEDLKDKQSEVFDLKKKILDSETKIKMQLTMFEQVRADRNMFSKNLVEAQEEITELKHKLKIKTFQIEQLKEDIGTKENLLLKEEFALQKVEKEKESLKLDLQRTNQDLKDAKERANQLLQEEKRLLRIITEADNERHKMVKDLTQISNDRDILGTQLVRRNGEVTLLYEKVKILQSVLHKGEAQYDQRLEDIRLLKIEIKRLRQDKAILARSMNNLSDLRQEIFHLEKDFTRERLKCRALEEELQNPLNVHRWRKLEGADPTTYELIQKVQILQKRLINANEDSIKKENQLKETERLYLNLRQMLARQPGPETLSQLHKTQNALRERGAKIKTLMAELTMYETQISEYKYDLDQVNKELKELKKKYFALKRREQKVKEKESELARDNNFLPVLESINENTVSKSKFVGGGFNLTPSAPVPRITT